MINLRKAAQLHLAFCLPGTDRLLWAGRSLLLLFAVSLASMPFTQQLWVWDRFLHGGQDFELGMLMILSVISLAVVLLKSCKPRLIAWFATLRILAPGEGGEEPGIALRYLVSSSCMNPLAATFPDLSSIPLLI